MKLLQRVDPNARTCYGLGLFGLFGLLVPLPSPCGCLGVTLPERSPVPDSRDVLPRPQFAVLTHSGCPNASPQLLPDHAVELIGGYMPGSHGVDSIIVGYYEGSELMFVSRVRAGLVPVSRREVFQKLQPIVIEDCPFANLPERGRSRWGESLTVEKMKQCVWVKPKLSARIEFLEHTEGHLLRHSRFVYMND